MTRSDEVSSPAGDVPAVGLLRVCLSAAVPLQIEKLRRSGGATRVRDAVDVLASNGDALLRRSPALPDEPGTAKTFNHLARAVAVLALRPGGGHLFGAVWCADHSPCGALTTGEDHVQRGSIPCGQCVAEGRCGDEPGVPA